MSDLVIFVLELLVMLRPAWRRYLKNAQLSRGFWMWILSAGSGVDPRQLCKQRADEPLYARRKQLRYFKERVLWMWVHTRPRDFIGEIRGHRPFLCNTIAKTRILLRFDGHGRSQLCLL